MLRVFRKGINSGINGYLRKLGYEFVRLGKRSSYLSAKPTLQAAKTKRLSVCEYVEELWDQQGCTARVVQEMRKAECLTPCERVCENGPGTGRYLELVLQEIHPKQYEIYETAGDWAAWLTRTYGPSVVRQSADGRTLRHTASHSCGLVHAHGVFVYLSLLHAFEYFSEMLRVCKPGGSIVFDFYPAEEFDEGVILRWLKYEDRYPVVLPAAHVRSFFLNRGCHLIHDFYNPHGHSRSHYCVFQLRSPALGVMA